MIKFPEKAMLLVLITNLHSHLVRASAYCIQNLQVK
jgi:hypothetical protein